MDRPPAGTQTQLESVMRDLCAARRWLGVLSVVGFIGVLLFVLLAISLAIIASKTHWALAIASGSCLITAAMFTWPCVALWRYGKALSRLHASPPMETLMDALSIHVRFWRSFAIATVISIVMLVASIITIPLALKSTKIDESDDTYESAFPEPMDLPEID